MSELIKPMAEHVFDLVNQVEKFGDSDIEVVLLKGEPWFKGNDVARVLGYSIPKNAIRDNVDSEDKKALYDLVGVDRGNIHPRFNQNDLKSIYINEPGSYSLVMGSKLPTAKAFKRWITSDLLPTLRKKGSYQMEQEYIERTRRLEQEKEQALLKVQEAEQKSETIRQQLAQKDAEIARIEKQRLALSSYVRNMERLEKNQVFYLITSPAYAAQSRFEFGGVKDPKDLRGRLSSYNTGRAEGDLHYFAKIIKCNNYKCIEERFHVILKNFKDKPEARKEMVHLRYDLLVQVTDLICENSDREVDFINEKCQTFLHETVYADPVIPAPIDLGSFIEIIYSRNGEVKENKVDVSGWTDEQIYAKIEEIIESVTFNTKKIRYNLGAQKDTLRLELAWSDLTPHMKQLKGYTMTDWRAKTKEWYSNVKPTRLVIKGLGLRRS